MPIYAPLKATPVTAAFTASAVSGTNATSYTFSSQALGTASSSRMIVVGITGSSNSGSASTISSVTVGGESATKAKEQVDGTEAGYRFLIQVLLLRQLLVIQMIQWLLQFHVLKMV